MLPSTGISSTLVGNELGISSHAWSTLCTSSKINMWSRWKPIRVDRTEGITEAILQNLKYGLDYPVFTQLGEAKTIFNGNLNGWEYIRPDTKMRIGDFRNYKHNASTIVKSINLPSTGVNTYESSSVGASVILNISSGDVAIKEIYPNGVYFGIIIENGDFIKYGTGTKIYGSSGDAASVILNTYNIPIGTYKVYAVLCTEEYINNTTTPPNSPPSLKFIPLPNTKVGTLVVSSTSASVTLRAQGDSSGDVTWTCTIKSAIPLDLSNNHIYLRFVGSDFDDPLLNGETMETIEDTLVIANVTKTLSGTTYLPQPSKNYRMWITLQGANFTASTIVLKPM